MSLKIMNKIFMLFLVVFMVSCYEEKLKLEDTELGNAVKNENVDEVTKILHDLKTGNDHDIELEKRYYGNRYRKSGYTILQEAVKTGNLKIVKQLVDAGANVNAYGDGEDNSALHIAIRKNHNNIVDYLIESGSYTNSDYTEVEVGDRVELKDCASGTPGMFAGCNWNVNKDWTPLHQASKYNSAYSAEKLIGLGVEIDSSDGRIPLHVASEFESFEVAEVLVEHGADVNSSRYFVGARTNHSPLYYAVSNDDVEMASLFIKNEADVNFKVSASALGMGDNVHLIHLVAKKGNPQIASLFIENEVDVFKKAKLPHYSDEPKRNPKEWAEFFGHTKVAQMFLKAEEDSWFTRSRRIIGTD